MGNKFNDHQPEPNGSGFLEHGEGLLLSPVSMESTLYFTHNISPEHDVRAMGQHQSPRLASCSRQQYTLGGIAGLLIHFFLLSLEFFSFSHFRLKWVN